MIYLEMKMKKGKYETKEGWGIIDVMEVSSKVASRGSEDIKFLYTEKADCLSIPEEVDGLPVVAIGGSLHFPQWITELWLPDTISYIGPDAFEKQEITILHIGKKVRHINFLYNLDKLKQITVSDKSGYLKAQNGSLYTNDYKTLVWGKNGRIEVGTEVIGVKAFRGLKIDELYIPSSVTIISEYAFENCEVGKISVSGNLHTIRKYAFFKCIIDELEFRDGEMNPLYFQTYTILESYIRKLSLPKRTDRVYDYAFVIRGLESISFSGGQYHANAFNGDFETLREVTMNLENKENLPSFGLEGLDALIKSTSMPIMAEQINEIWSEKLYW